MEKVAEQRISINTLYDMQVLVILLILEGTETWKVAITKKILKYLRKIQADTQGHLLMA